MPSVVGLLEQHELAARRRVDELREEADRIEAELAVAEQEWQEWTITRKRVGVLLSAPGDGSADAVAAREPGDAGTRAEASAPPTAAAKRSRRCWCGVRGWLGRCCRWTTSASCRPLPIGSGSVKGR